MLRRDGEEGKGNPVDKKRDMYLNITSNKYTRTKRSDYFEDNLVAIEMVGATYE